MRLTEFHVRRTVFHMSSESYPLRIEKNLMAAAQRQANIENRTLASPIRHAVAGYLGVQKKALTSSAGACPASLFPAMARTIISWVGCFLAEFLLVTY